MHSCFNMSVMDDDDMFLIISLLLNPMKIIH